MSKIFVLNGVNLGSLGTRRPEVYGSLSLERIQQNLQAEFPDVHFEFRQTDHEGEFIAEIQASVSSDGLVVNPGAWTHYSYAIHDALEVVSIPKVEVHLSNIHAREGWRRISVISPAVHAVVAGMGTYGYTVAVRYILSS